MLIYFQLFAAALVSVVLSLCFYLLQKKTGFGKLPYVAQQIIIGLFFGCASVLATEVFGVDLGTAIANARDAAPLCAGLLFGAPAGIIAGIIGGVERWFGALWGAGMYSRVACSISTVLAGIYAALLRKYMFDNKRPTVGFGFAIGIVMEVLHLSILFLTHLDGAEEAYNIVKVTTFPMLLCNAVSVALALLTVSLVSHGFAKGKKRMRSIAQKVQSWMLISVVLAYLATTFFVYVLQTNTAVADTDSLLKTTVQDVKSEMESRKNVNVNDLSAHRHVGSSGFVIAVDLLADPHSAVNSLTDLRMAGIAIYEDTPTMTMNEGEVYGEDSYWLFDKLDHYYLIAVMTKTQAFRTRDAAVYVNSYMEVLVFAMLFAIIYALIKKLVVNNIRSVNNHLEMIIGGNLDISVNVRSSAEFSSLSDDINSTVTTLKHYIEEAAARIDKELSFAKNIQHSSLPSVFPAYPNVPQFSLYATMNTAKEVGGDFYDFYMLGDRKLVFLIADVSGKGIPAAMFMMQAKTMIKNLAETGIPVDEILTVANEKLCESNEAGMFVTTWLGMLDVITGEVTFANAGHNPPLIYRKETDSFAYLKSKVGLVLAGMDGIVYKKNEITLAPGDRIYLYTDGVTEATDANVTLYGEERLLAFLNSHKELNDMEMLPAIQKDIDAFVGEAPQFDDITMLIMDYKG